MSIGSDDSGVRFVGRNRMGGCVRLTYLANVILTPRTPVYPLQILATCVANFWDPQQRLFPFGIRFKPPRKVPSKERWVWGR